MKCKMYRVTLWLIHGLPKVRMEEHYTAPDYEVYLDDEDILRKFGVRKEVYLGRVRKTRDTSGSATEWTSYDPRGRGIARYQMTRERAATELFWDWEKKRKEAEKRQAKKKPRKK